MVADLQYYLNSRSSLTEISLPFEENWPDYILRKFISYHPSSSSLLRHPKSIQKLVSDENSPLRQPLDYFAETYKINTYDTFFRNE